MKSRIWLFLIVILFSINGLAQKENLPFSQQYRKKTIPARRASNLDFTLGYIPKASSEGIKSSVALNNILFHRAGVYTSLEYGLNSQNLMNTLGGTITVHKLIYLFGGLDLFTDEGILQTKSFEGRKEIGLGITPYKRSVLLVGWSSSVGLTISVGYRLFL